MTLDELGEDDSGLSAIKEDSGSERDLKTAPSTQSKQKAPSTLPAKHYKICEEDLSLCQYICIHSNPQLIQSKTI